MAEEQQILENTFFYTIFKYISYALLIVSGLLITKFLGPSAFGVYSAMMLILNYSKYTFMGFYATCFKKLSFYKGKGELQRLQEVRDSTFGPSFVITLIGSLLMFLASFILSYESQILSALRLASVLIILQHFFYFYTIYLRTDKKFTMFGWIEVILNIVRVLLILLFLKGLTVSLVMVSLIIAYIVSLAIGLSRKSYPFRISFTFKQAKKAFLFGVPNTILGVMSTIFTSIDKLMIMSFMDRAALGLYSFAVLIMEMITFIPANIAIILLPSQLERYGAYTSGQKVRNMFVLPMIIVSYFLPLLIGAAFFFSELVVEIIFPSYLGSLSTLYVLIFAAFFVANLYIFETYLVSVNKEKSILFPKLLFLGGGILLNLYAIKIGQGIYGVALATAFVYCCYYLFLLSFAHLTVYEAPLERLKESVIAVFPIIYTGIVLAIITTIWEVKTPLLAHAVSRLGQYGLFLLLFVPLLYYANKRTKIFNLIYQVAKDKISKALNRC